MNTREQKAEMLKLTANVMPEAEAKTLLENGRKTLIREGVREKHPQHDVEAILRSAVVTLCDAVADLYVLIGELHEGEIVNRLDSEKIAELRELNASVEAIKKSIKIN